MLLFCVYALLLLLLLLVALYTDQNINYHLICYSGIAKCAQNLK